MQPVRHDGVRADVLDQEKGDGAEADEGERLSEGGDGDQPARQGAVQGEGEVGAVRRHSCQILFNKMRLFLMSMYHMLTYSVTVVALKLVF